MKRDKPLAKSSIVNGKFSLDKEEILNCHEILKKLKKEERSGMFHLPVDYKGMGLWDYPQLIKRPMDFSTVKRKINKYSSMDDFFNDLQLIWDNCKTYNMEDSVRYILN